ncbi:hypothetical protein LOTGIDRAFT_234927 [Lottia gigantea]|uniref:Acyl-CoA-binding domain-containing protein 5 n=1 Tax=Lottia gigantea TaxID=225164 RepID=V3ZYG3_LOTGI|nr:hypothetical protein LOTGIDRAFT_234927 [Lottia gigantea]ESO87680.1 hypothetical protein LOTGIDRAFT_234927 [Lottia gigantea]
MADTTAKTKFDAAVKVIRGLPKNGTFQPSHELMLKFYGFYKQSTEGPCTQSKPGFWDVVNKAKWEAWNKLGDMPKEEAMLSYVDELKSIIEAMPQTKEVGHFLDKLGFFYEVVDEKDEVRSSSMKKLGNGDIQHDGQDSEGEEQEIETESNVSWNQDAELDPDFNHSTAVEEIMRKSEFINGNQKHITVSEYQTTHSKVSFDNQRPNINCKREEIHVNGGMNGVEESGSESDEFCDTSDEPIQDPVVNGDISMQLNTSTPISKTGHHVRFSDVVDTPVLHSNQTSRNSQHRDLRLGLLSNSVPFAAKTKKEAMLSDSLLVNATSNDSLNLSTDSQLGVSLHHPDNSILNQSECESVMSRGGGNVQKGQGSFPVSSDSFNDSVGSRGNSGNVSGSRRGLFNTNSGGSGEDGDDVLRGRNYSDLNEQIAVALVRLQQDMNGVLSRLTNLEAMTERQNQERERKELQKKSQWWPFGNLSKRTAAFIFVWPFVAHFIIALVCKRKRYHWF